MGILEGILYMMWRGLAIGIIISAPMGPVGILCVQRTLDKGRATGFFTGVGAAISDLFYCLLTGFGLSFIEDFLKANQDMIQIIGSVVLIIFGIYLFRSNPARTLKKPEEERVSKRRNILSGFLFTFSNPLIIFLIIGLFARFNFLLPEISFGHYLVGYFFIFVGALVWWWMVTLFIDKVRTHFNLRSMWLINKITGGIIMVFGLVGIITAVTSIASAHEQESIYLNSTRGFGSFEDPQRGRGEPLVIENQGSDTIYKFLALNPGEEFSFSFRAANIHNERDKRYKYFKNGKSVTVKNPGWGISLKSKSGDLSGFSFKTISYDTDELYPAKMEITSQSRTSGELKSLSSGMDLFDGMNSYRLQGKSGIVELSGGNRDLRPLHSLNIDWKNNDSIGVFVAPGAALAVDYIVVSSPGRIATSVLQNKFVDNNALSEYLKKTKDPIEGIYEVFDRSIDTDLLRIGGEYRMALVKDDNQYNFIYISGAEKNCDAWQFGKVKALLRPASYSGIFDVEWFDPASIPLRGVIKAQIESGDIIKLQFESYQSEIRLRKISKNS